MAQLVTSEGVEIKLSTAGATQAQLEEIVAAKKFQQWYASVMEKSGQPLAYVVQKMDITDVNWFGKPNLGFLKVTSMVTRTDEQGKPKNKEVLDNPKQVKEGKPPRMKLVPDTVSAITFVRGGAVAILVRVTVEETNKSYYLLTRQIRFPVGDFCIEACAGMIDGNTHAFGGVAAAELKEELGLTISEAELEANYLGQFYPSPGGCDEYLRLYYVDKIIPQEMLDTISGMVHGEEGSNEAIELIKVPERDMNKVLLEIGDAKAEIAYRRYLNVRRKKLCGYGPVTGRCAIKYKGKDNQYCDISQAGRCIRGPTAPKRQRRF